MGTIELLELIEKLPADKKKEVEDLVFTLVKNSHSGNFNTVPEKPRSKFGDLKGFVTFIADDFDEPLEDFNDYM